MLTYFHRVLFVVSSLLPTAVALGIDIPTPPGEPTDSIVLPTLPRGPTNTQSNVAFVESQVEKGNGYLADRKYEAALAHFQLICSFSSLKLRTDHPATLRCQIGLARGYAAI